METGPALQSLKLAPHAQAIYAESGYFFPVRIVGRPEAKELAGHLVDHMPRHANELCGLLQRNRRFYPVDNHLYPVDNHLFMPWVSRAVPPWLFHRRGAHFHKVRSTTCP